MQWIHQTVPNWLQWIGLVATLLGTVLAFVSAFFAWLASRRAEDARDAAIRLARTAELADLINDTHELQTMLARDDFEGIASKCVKLRGRIARFKEESYHELRETELQNLDLGREQLEAVGKTALDPKIADTNRDNRVQIGLGKAEECLNQVFAIRRQRSQEVSR